MQKQNPCTDSKIESEKAEKKENYENKFVTTKSFKQLGNTNEPWNVLNAELVLRNSKVLKKGGEKIILSFNSEIWQLKKK